MEKYVKENFCKKIRNIFTIRFSGVAVPAKSTLYRLVNKFLTVSISEKKKKEQDGKHNGFFKKKH